MRVVKHLGARSCPTDTAKVLLAVPYFPGEKIVSVSIDAYFASGDSSAIDQPGEVNWHGISIPWSLVYATGMMDAGAVIDQMTGVPNIDKLYTQWLRNIDEGTGERFGGDADDDVEDTSGEEGHVNEELLHSGPIGVHEWFKREVVMRPLAAEGNTVIRFGDTFAARTSIPAHAMGGLALFGMVRYLADATTEFNIEHDNSTARENLGQLIAGDYTKVKARIEGDTSAIGDYLRTVLFGGDNYIEADTLKGPAGKAVVKASFAIDSAISRRQ